VDLVEGIWNTKEADYATEIWPTEHSHCHIIIVVIIIIIVIIHIITIFTWHHSDFSLSKLYFGVMNNNKTGCELTMQQ